MHRGVVLMDHNLHRFNRYHRHHKLDGSKDRSYYIFNSREKDAHVIKFLF